MEDTTQFPQQIKDDGKQSAYIPGRDEKVNCLLAYIWGVNVCVLFPY